MTVRVTVGPPDPDEHGAAELVQYRAGERDDWAAGVPTEGSSLIEFRASERSGR